MPGKAYRRPLASTNYEVLAKGDGMYNSQPDNELQGQFGK
jgi:hypothetical protein